MKAVDTEFSDAQWQALNGDAEAMAAILRDVARPLDDAEREVLAMMIERLAEHARGDIGGDVGRREKGAGHPDVRRVVERYADLIAKGRQKSEAKALVGSEFGLSVRTVESYLRMHRERQADIERSRVEGR